ncbi:hypothetical protein J8273_4004 [Carpediemonas membranifera]|uniref:Uncharacterized protein n=1 Tax=Carpediemonas membranifera TaxID=201153 RepID=A0A8J6AUB3_9EUKA|nr:hypothetical protein J8273_4004 [Carpediemonas membranifera]|eukprot:KAG9394363.1 hypothetical protein J8273_4004 [Carpediemonas membranifera]
MDIPIVEDMDEVIAPPSTFNSHMAHCRTPSASTAHNDPIFRDLEEYTGSLTLPTPQFRPETVTGPDDTLPEPTGYAMIHASDFPQGVTRPTHRRQASTPVMGSKCDVSPVTHRPSSVRSAAPSSSLFHRSQHRLAQRKEALEQQKREKEAKELAECTFKPTINKRPTSATLVRSAEVDVATRLFNESMKRKQAAQAIEQTKNEQFKKTHTFSPHTNRSRNPSRPTSRGAVFERLYDSRPSSTGPESPASRTVSSKQTFDEFISRQQRAEFRKKVRAEEVLLGEMARSTFKPMINKASEKMIDSRSEASWARLTEPRKPAAGEEYSFTPSIQERSRQMRGRSAMELSVIDPMKAQVRRDQARRAKEQAEAEEATFTPKIVSRCAKSRLGAMLQDPAQYLQQLSASAQAKEEERQRVFAQREEAELEGCSFRPTINECPAFMKNVAARRKAMRGDA